MILCIVSRFDDLVQPRLFSRGTFFRPAVLAVLAVVVLVVPVLVVPVLVAEGEEHSSCRRYGLCIWTFKWCKANEG